MEEPLYGFIVEVTVAENQTCQILPSLEDDNTPQCELLRDDVENENEIDTGTNMLNDFETSYLVNLQHILFT